MLYTPEFFKHTKNYTVFASGLAYEGDIPVKWVDRKGGIEDWAIYYSDNLAATDEYIAQHGDRFFSIEKIKSFVQGNSDFYKLYRY